MDILNRSVSQMTDLSFECSCGRTHSIGIKEIVLGKGAAERAADVVSGFCRGRIFILADNCTYAVLGAKIEADLKSAGFKVKIHVFRTKHPLVPDEKALGTLLIEMEPETELIVAVGSGTLNDLARMLGSRTKVSYMIIGTAPSMDGYASTVSPLIVEGAKKTFPAIYPQAIIADTGIMAEAPEVMLRAGFGDIIGKYTALADWSLANKLQEEYLCQTIVSLVQSAIHKCVDSIRGIVGREVEAVGNIAEALIISGIAMGLSQNSRPASGAEHHLAHYWEMDALAKGNDHPLHGNSVGVGAVVVSSIYELLGIEERFQISVPKPGTIRSMLQQTGASETPAQLGIDRELFHRSILKAKEVRPRYTILQYAHGLGVLEKIADQLTERFY